MTARISNVSEQTHPFIEGLGRILSAPVQAVQALERTRERAQVRAELAHLDPHLLADLGLRRSLINPSRFCQQNQG